MSVHVCPCMHHGAVEWHLRYPGMSQEAAQGIADKINSGMLDSKQAKVVELPERDIGDDPGRGHSQSVRDYQEGWNDCLDEIERRAK